FTFNKGILLESLFTFFFNLFLNCNSLSVMFQQCTLVLPTVAQFNRDGAANVFKILALKSKGGVDSRRRYFDIISRFNHILFLKGIAHMPANRSAVLYADSLVAVDKYRQFAAGNNLNIY